MSKPPRHERLRRHRSMLEIAVLAYLYQHIEHFDMPHRPILRHHM
jgi:hypothetical protein